MRVKQSMSKFSIDNRGVAGAKMGKYKQYFILSTLPDPIKFKVAPLFNVKIEYNYFSTSIRQHFYKPIELVLDRMR